VDAECDAVIFVDAPREQRLARVAETRGWSEAELDRREKAQMPLDEKRRRSNHVIENDGSRDALVRAVKRVLIEILGPRRAPARRTETSGPPSDRR
jgi:dephospho-CoA kinase